MQLQIMCQTQYVVILNFHNFHHTHGHKVKTVVGKMKSKPIDSCIKDSARCSKRVPCRTKNPHASILVHIFCS
jgi:hypothetical protein